MDDFVQQPDNTTRQKLGRNNACWCGSGKKYKRCHWASDRASGTRRPPGLSERLEAIIAPEVEAADYLDQATLTRMVQTASVAWNTCMKTG